MSQENKLRRPRCDMIPPKWTLEKVKTLEVFSWIKELSLQKNKRLKQLKGI